jgi:hypothetical protein
MTRRREWDGVGNWSSHPCKSPAQANRESFAEMLCVLKWDGRAAAAFRRALKDYDAAGRPGIPLGAEDYRKTWAAQQSS